MPKEKEFHKGDTDELVNEEKNLVLFNDDHNTFDHVIEALVAICKHDQHQAEQCALVAHFKGKCTVKTGAFEELKPLHEAMGLRDLTVEIQ
ncbi:MAG TPA: ATP-dependent Clp protease adaptor ClpS [Bacteroidales bacterium]|nr:ATP-dependent Clp protease adaptor ClpS [Bacteroidales bacterium]